ncbi:CaiB/BaiF CoA transferase family protein [Leucobacter luti]|uniref:Crotonobetainyl-CoA:carnitine CoA-transferase CaiB-like acyl-CoA transferase n=1 Tax=Leucobacter luti TaxID=340320 RepID=A0A4Q7TRG2_9MICO|nr:CoA transferase [Leucobacter luti]MBL3699925.1 CoA transferase [Leucobacter luti]RZT62757.1 crotonobetainyl-CoA:carnitine CoA-transferase CaiB-like acyl-CoA transferase [Leucobacter luti]
MSKGALDGVVVVDLSRALAGPHAGQMFGDLGARVIKVESPGTGDDTRSWGPPFVPGGDGAEHSTYFLSCNRNKESIALDLKSDDGRGVLRRLVARADVLIENFRTGVMARLGFDTATLAELNPRLVQLSITGFGHDGPEADRAGYDQIVQGEAGLMSLTGAGPDDPQRVGTPIADLLAGIHGVVGVLAALVKRGETGRGQVVRTSLLSSIVGVHAFQGTRATVAGQTPLAQGNHHPSIAPYGLFPCRDGAVQISVGNERLWAALCAEFGLDPEAPGLATNAERVAHHARTLEFVTAAFADHDAEPLLKRLRAAGIPAGKVRTLPEVYAWDQVASQGLLVDVEHPALGTITLPGPAIRFFDPGSGSGVNADPGSGSGAGTAPGSGSGASAARESAGAEAGAGEIERTRTSHTAPPTLNQHDAIIREWLAL